MKNNKIYFLGACLLCAVTAFSQNINLQPAPQELITRDKTIDLPAIYQLEGEKEPESEIDASIDELLERAEKDKNE